MRDNTEPGYRFSSMKALAVIAYKEKKYITKDRFVDDLNDLAKYWESFNWEGDAFNYKNVEAIIRFYDKLEHYNDIKSETLEDWLGYEFKKVGEKRNGRKQKEHLARIRKLRDFDYPDGSWINKKGPPQKRIIVLDYLKNHPEARKVDVIRETGLTKPTVYKYYDEVKKELENIEKNSN